MSTRNPDQARRRALAGPLALAFIAATSGNKAVAETRVCTPISSLPAVISKPGNYCLNNSLTTAIASGNALAIESDRVTLDCNGHRLENTAGSMIEADGIGSRRRSGISIRNCTVRGFRTGIRLLDAPGLPPPSDIIVAGNRVDRSTTIGIRIHADAAVIRGNLVTDTAISTPAPATPIGIRTSFGVDVVDNIVDRVGSPAATRAEAIVVSDSVGATVAGNRIRGVTAGHSFDTFGIRLAASARNMTIRDNMAMTASTGIFLAYSCAGGSNLARDNVEIGGSSPLVGCNDGDGNRSYPLPSSP